MGDVSTSEETKVLEKRVNKIQDAGSCVM